MWRLYEPAEFYDRTPDPDERGGLAGRPEHTEVEQRMNRALLRPPADAANAIPAGEDPRYPSVDLPVPAGHPGPDGEVETAPQQLARAFVRWQESRR
ncbi:hypothetical protein [Streptomyces sp. NPDC055140]